MISNGKKLLFYSILLSGIFVFVGSLKVIAADCDNIPTDTKDHVEEKVKCLTDRVGQLGSQANTLKNQISQFDYQIKLTTLKISQTEAQINLLGGRIDQLEVSLQDLTKAFSSRAVETYKLSKFENNFFFVLSASDIKDATSRFHYLQKIEEEDRSLLTRLQEAQTTYQGQKADQETLQKQLKDQQSVVNTQKASKAKLLSTTQNDEKKYQSLLSQAKSQLSAFNRFVAGHGGAGILSNQTKCGAWGCYYNQRDSAWGNIGMGGSSYSMASYGCLATSVSMMASHNGKNIKPGDIAVNSDAFVPGTGYLYHDFSINGIKVTVNTASKSILDSELSAGRPVIAGLYSGPDHFIVILRKEGDKYIMNDPFMENGSERPLTDKYSVSDITSLRLVSFN